MGGGGGVVFNIRGKGCLGGVNVRGGKGLLARFFGLKGLPRKPSTAGRTLNICF